MERQEPRRFIGDVRAQANLGLGVCAIHATMLTAFLRVPGTCGDKHFANMLGLLGTAVMFFTGPLAQSKGLIQLGWMQIGMLLVHRLYRARNDRKGIQVHSRYIGDSWFGLIVSDRTAKTFCEPVFCFLVGFLFIRSDPGLAKFLMAGLLSLLAMQGYISAKEKSEERAYRDARIEAEHAARRLGRS